MMELSELVAQYGVQCATTGNLAPSKELADALAHNAAKRTLTEARELLERAKKVSYGDLVSENFIREIDDFLARTK